MTKSIETMATERGDFSARLNEVRNEERELMNKISRLDAQIFERTMDQSDEWQLVEDWTTLRPGSQAAYTIVRPVDEVSYSTIGQVYQIDDTPGRSISDGGTNFVAVGTSGDLPVIDDDYRAKVWVKVAQ